MPVRNIKNVAIPVAQHQNIGYWNPKIGDLVFYYGWWTKWVGLVTMIDKNMVTIVYDGIPLLLLTMDEEFREKKTIKISKSRIINSSPGKYNILQGDCWFIHA